MTLLCLVPRPETFSCGPSETAAAQIGWMLCVRSKALRCKNARKNSVARSCCEQIPHYTNVVSEAVRNSPNPAVAAWQHQGKALPALDSMLEATALHWDLTIVTRNTGDFVEAPTLNPWLAPG